MSVGYTPVQWNKHKRVYDVLLALGLGLYIIVFVGVSMAARPSSNQVNEVQLLIRAFATAAMILLHLILMIGPLTRLNQKVFPLLYNRRHFGVTMFFVALIHGILSIIWYHAGGDENPLLSLFTANTHYTSLRHFPFQTLGAAALLILFLMAATSHDFWLKNLTPPIWKALHMSVYLAYGLIVAHVALGAIQTETSVIYPILIAVGFLSVISLHIAAGLKETRRDRRAAQFDKRGWLCAGSYDDIESGRAKVVCGGKTSERIAVFRYENKVSAIASVCAHQNGPLGEGKVIDGCVTCPWHGYQYLPYNGQSPPPFTEKVPTYKVRIEDRMIYVDPNPLPLGTAVEPAAIEESLHAS
jgi:nitrite reductase/ring-hydroxylating ferredoxin subunit